MVNPDITVRLVDVNGIQLLVGDSRGSIAAEIVLQELKRDDYGLRGIEFGFGDTIIDIGSHVGIFSMYLARRYPFITIISFEPTPWNFANLKRNLQQNGIGNVHALNLAVSADGRDVGMSVEFSNTGGASGFVQSVVAGKHQLFTARSTTLEAVFADHGLTCCKLLKIDCEGAEHEILKTTSILPRVEYLSAEFHENSFLRTHGHTMESASRTRLFPHFSNQSQNHKMQHVEVKCLGPQKWGRCSIAIRARLMRQPDCAHGGSPRRAAPDDRAFKQ